MTAARLILEDGSVYEGEAFGSRSPAIGEVVFNTSLTGYQEIATDPSYRFQIVVMTYPHIGNYGIETTAEQSERPQCAGFVIRDLAPETFNPGSKMSLNDYFALNGIPGVYGVDTRAITRKLRSEGSMKGLIVSDEKTLTECTRELHESPSMAGLDLVQNVTTRESYNVPATGTHGDAPPRRIAVYDYGVKRDILRHIAANGCDVTVFPAAAPVEQILQGRFDGVVLSNGPGDPEPVTYAQENIGRLIGRVPLFGICLGHQLLGIALGGRTYKLKFGHHGGNHPVKELQTGRVEITAQNHGFAVDPDSLPAGTIDFTHTNLNDGTLEGFRHRQEPVMAVQYHPEAAPGPHDSFHLFEKFLQMIEEFRYSGTRR
jgi:carbamoyl-phosphate synthase small subunit